MTFTPHTGLFGQEWIALSRCGHYAIAHDKTDPRVTKFQALFIPGVWATAQKIGRALKTRDAAEANCERHSLTPDLTKLAKGI